MERLATHHLNGRSLPPKSGSATEPDKESRVSLSEAIQETVHPDAQSSAAAMIVVVLVAFCALVLGVAYYLSGYWGPVGIVILASLVFLAGTRGAAS